MTSYDWHLKRDGGVAVNDLLWGAFDTLQEGVLDYHRCSFEERQKYLSGPFLWTPKTGFEGDVLSKIFHPKHSRNDLQTILWPPLKVKDRGHDMTWCACFPSTILYPNHSEKKKHGTLKRHDSKAELPSGEIQLLLSRCNGQVLATACYCRCLGFWWVQFTSQFKLMILVLLLGEVSWNLLHKEIPAWRIDWKRLNEQVDGSAQNWGKSSKSWQVYQGSGDDLFASLDA